MSTINELERAMLDACRNEAAAKARQEGALARYDAARAVLGDAEREHNAAIRQREIAFTEYVLALRALDGTAKV